MNNDNYIGNLIRFNRERRKLTQLELANKLGYHNSQFVSLFERGLSKVPNETLGKISKILRIKPKKFITHKVNQFEKHLIEEIAKGLN